MTTPTVAELLKFANLQMAAEAFLKNERESKGPGAIFLTKGLDSIIKSVTPAKARIQSVEFSAFALSSAEFQCSPE